MHWLDPLFWTDLVEDHMEEISDVRELMKRMRLKQPGLARSVSRSPSARRVRMDVTPLTTGVVGEARVWFQMPIRIQGLANSRTHWREKDARAGDHRNLAKNATRSCFNALKHTIVAPFEVTLTRIISPRGRFLDAHDNLRDGFKSIVDGIADALGVNDGDLTRVKWEYAQMHGDDWGVHVEIEGRIVE
jgi:hypothetical protein